MRSSTATDSTSATMPLGSVQTQTTVPTRGQAMQALIAAAAFGILLVCACPGSLAGLILAGKALVALRVVSLVGLVFFARRFFQMQQAMRQFFAQPAQPLPENPSIDNALDRASQRSASSSLSSVSQRPTSPLAEPSSTESTNRSQRVHFQLSPPAAIQSVQQPLALTEAANSAVPDLPPSTTAPNASDASTISTDPQMSNATTSGDRQSPCAAPRHTRAHQERLHSRRTNASNPVPYFLHSDPAHTPLQNALCQADLTMGPYQNTRAVLLSASVAPSSNDVLQRIVLDHALATDLHNQEMSSTCSTSHILPRSEAMAGQSHWDNHLDSTVGRAYLHGQLNTVDPTRNHDDSTSSSARVSSRPADLAANTMATRLTTKAGKFEKSSRLAAIADKANRFNR
ncbi:MAG: hypothetical protein ACOYKZ_02040 [Chlamydiia bacterium]